MKKLSLKSGFTLIELLVVIAIIGILASLALVSYSAAQRQARDTQRRSDLAQYRNGLENYATANSSLYPVYAPPLSPVNLDTDVCPTDLTPNGFISSCPTDPIIGNYKYISGNIGASYVIWADLESGYYWVICSTGQVGETELDTEPLNALCPTLKE